MAITKVETTSCGIHPRSEHLVKTSRAFERGRATNDELTSAFRRDAQALVLLETQHGISRISDGQIRWQDPIRPLSESVTGLEFTADLSRWFDTNTFYKKPSVVGELGISDPEGTLAARFLETSISYSKGDGKRIVFLPGPYTLASLVDDKFYGSKTELVVAFSKVLANVATALSENGVSVIQFNEPSLVYGVHQSPVDKLDLAVYLEANSAYLSSMPVEVRIHTYFGDAAAVTPQLVNLAGVSAVGIDFTRTRLDDLEPGLFEGKILGVGCVDARNSLVEDAEWIARFAASVAQKLRPEGIVLLPSSDLKYLPRTYADEKLVQLSMAAQLLRGEFRLE